jgi:hypothetical protein
MAAYVGEQYTRSCKQRVLYKSFELSSSIQGLARVFYENSEPNANTSNINKFRKRPCRLTGTFRMGHPDSRDELGMFVRDSDVGFRCWTMLQPGGRNVNTHGRG